MDVLIFSVSPPHTYLKHVLSSCFCKSSYVFGSEENRWTNDFIIVNRPYTVCLLADHVCRVRPDFSYCFFRGSADDHILKTKKKKKLFLVISRIRWCLNDSILKKNEQTKFSSIILSMSRLYFMPSKLNFPSDCQFIYWSVSSLYLTSSRIPICYCF
jgi:hypothetical protein